MTASNHCHNGAVKLKTISWYYRPTAKTPAGASFYVIFPIQIYGFTNSVQILQLDQCKPLFTEININVIEVQTLKILCQLILPVFSIFLNHPSDYTSIHRKINICA